MSKLYIYYFILTAVVLGRSMATVYQRSLVVHHGASLNELERQKSSLQKEKIALSNQLASLNSLSAVRSSNQYAQFQPISKPLVVAASTLTASQF
jgi:hypothetical protein